MSMEYIIENAKKQTIQIKRNGEISHKYSLTLVMLQCPLNLEAM